MKTAVQAEYNLRRAQKAYANALKGFDKALIERTADRVIDCEYELKQATSDISRSFWNRYED